MTDQPADLLTTAANRLRAAATLYGDPGPWTIHQGNGFLRVGPAVAPRRGWTPQPGADLPEERRDTAEYIALMHPGVGLALADWLETSAEYYQPGVTHPTHVVRALAVARAVLGQDGGQPGPATTH
ncbi:hypothetical protein [Kitasatospora sp. NPDC047058]|uniref:hypothetical protein n=1 Tax=Kitasatospora sp. NPDC047058 TaxID=3155620 RepID=UPI003405232B